MFEYKNNNSNKNAWSDLLKKVRNDKKNLVSNLRKVQEIATVAAIQTAVEKTPPLDGEDARGTGTITGSLKSAWARDSIVESKKVNSRYITVLANRQPYASFVNDGHVMNKHFVPGLIINPYSGLLERMPAGMEGGIMVGTKTKYVVGKYMKENALITYYKTLNEQAEDIIKNMEINK